MLSKLIVLVMGSFFTFQSNISTLYQEDNFIDLFSLVIPFMSLAFVLFFIRKLYFGEFLHYFWIYKCL